MSIKYIDSISIDGKGSDPNRKLFNGYVYQLSYDISMGEGKSQITANIVSEDGSYSIAKTDLNYSRVYPIKIGNKINVNGYLEKARFVVNGDSKILELKFCDTSVKLDRYLVGLYKRQGLVSKDNLLIVGREVHPCDKNYDGMIDSIQDLEDKCHPCRNTAEKEAEKKLVDCKDLSKYTIFPVNYNFTEFAAVIGKVFKIILPTDLNPKYRVTYTGTVREVLNNFCSDFGWIFYWENETIKFLDLRRTIEVNQDVNSYCPNLSAFEEEWSIDGTEDKIISTYYERPGSRTEYKCEDAIYLEIPPYTSAANGLSSELKVTAKIPTVAAGLMQYDQNLRDLWYYYDYYSLRAATDYTPGKECPRIGLTILSRAILLDDVSSGGGGNPLSTGSLDTVGLEPSLGMFPPKGFPLNPDATSDLDFLKAPIPTPALETVKAKISSNEKYKMCFELLNAEDQWTVANGLARNPKDFFFYIGLIDPVLDAACKSEEQDFGRNFMGKYYALQPDLNNPVQRKFFEDYTFFQDKICNIQIRTNDKKISYNFINTGGGGTTTFYNNPGITENGDADTLSNLPFAQWLILLRESAGAAANLNRARMFKLLLITKEGNLFYPTPGQQISDEDDDGKTPPKDAIKNKLLIARTQKNASYLVAQANNAQGEFVPRKVTDLMNDPLDKNLDRSRVRIFVGRDIGKDNFRVSTANAVNISNSPGMPFDGTPITTQYEDEFDLKGKILFKYPDIKCKQIGNLSNLCDRITFKTPEANYSYFEPTYSNYGVVIEKTKEIKNYPDKLQTSFVNKTLISDKVSSAKLITHDITDNDIGLFENQINENAVSTCRYNYAKIKQFHDDYVNNLGLVFDKPIVNKTFTVEGIDISVEPTIGEGLISVQISMDDTGIRSTYNFGTRLMIPVKEDVLKANLLGSFKSGTEYTFIAPFKNSSNLNQDSG